MVPEIVPPVAVQVTEDEVAPTTVAVNTAVVPAGMDVVEGEIVMDSGAGLGGGAVTVIVELALSLPSGVETVTVTVLAVDGV